jgi:hypothetical protein
MTSAMAAGFDSTVAGKVDVTVTHSGMTAKFEVTIEAEESKDGCGSFALAGGGAGGLFIGLIALAAASIFVKRASKSKKARGQ